MFEENPLETAYELRPAMDKRLDIFERNCIDRFNRHELVLTGLKQQILALSKVGVKDVEQINLQKFAVEMDLGSMRERLDDIEDRLLGVEANMLAASVRSSWENSRCSRVDVNEFECSGSGVGKQSESSGPDVGKQVEPSGPAGWTLLEEECCLVARGSAPSLISADGQEDDEEELPESMYNYCMQRFTVSPNLWRDPALQWWVLLFVLQSVTLSSFCIVNDVEATMGGVLPADQRERSIDHCLFSKSRISGAPLMQWCIGYAAIVLVASGIRADDHDTFKAPFPKVSSTVLQWLVRFAWWWQTIHIPGVFVLECATLFARSADAMEVVMNTLAVTFIMEIDNMLYQNLLSTSEKRAYQQRAGVPIQEHALTSSQCSWAMFAVHLFVMISVFTVVLSAIGQGRLDGQAYVDYNWSILPYFYFALFGIRFVLQRVFSDPRSSSSFLARCRSVLPSSLGEAVAVAAWGGSFYSFGICLNALRIVTPFNYFSATEFLACVPG